MLGARLFECTRAVLAIEKSAQQIFGRPDDLKFRSNPKIDAITVAQLRLVLTRPGRITVEHGAEDRHMIR